MWFIQYLYEEILLFFVEGYVIISVGGYVMIVCWKIAMCLFLLENVISWRTSEYRFCGTVSRAVDAPGSEAYM